MYTIKILFFDLQYNYFVSDVLSLDLTEKLHANRFGGGLKLGASFLFSLFLPSDLGLDGGTDFDGVTLFLSISTSGFCKLKKREAMLN